MSKDASMLAKMLKVANSPAFGGSNITTLGRAIAILGMNNVRGLAISAAFQSIGAGRSTAPKFDRKALWRHSLGTATAARIIAKLRMPEFADELFTAGMLHSVGILALERFVPDIYNEVLEIAFEDNRPLHEIEREKLEYDHCDVGQVLCESWGLTGILRSACSFYVNPISDPDNFESTCVISLADTIASQCGLYNQTPRYKAEVAPGIMDALELPDAQLDAIRNVVMKELEKTEQGLKAA